MTKKIKCSVCHGWGTEKKKSKCVHCKGYGFIKLPEDKVETCEFCGGFGNMRKTCTGCGGSGWYKLKEEKTYRYHGRRR